MKLSASHGGDLDPVVWEFYRSTLKLMKEAGILFLVGGAYAFQRYTGISRHTKDFDLFVKPADVDNALKVLEEAGYRTELTFPHWLGKAFHEDAAVDVIFSSGNGVVAVDDAWFDRSTEEVVLDLEVRLCPVEEMIRSKAFIMERERYDGADIAHLLRASAPSLDWPFLVNRFGQYWRILYTHLILFGFIYPGERNVIPAWVMSEFARRLESENEVAGGDKQLCQGTLLSRQQYLIDTQEWGYKDARLLHPGGMTPADVKHWTEAINKIE